MIETENARERGSGVAVKAVYFKPGGKYYAQEMIELPRDGARRERDGGRCEMSRPAARAALDASPAREVVRVDVRRRLGHRRGASAAQFRGELTCLRFAYVLGREPEHHRAQAVKDGGRPVEGVHSVDDALYSVFHVDPPASSAPHYRGQACSVPGLGGEL